MTRRGVLQFTGLSLAAAALAGVVLGHGTRSRLREIGVENPRSHLRVKSPHTDHKGLLAGPFADGPSVTAACLKCHPESAREVMATSHWTWLGQEVTVPGHATPTRIGKANLINNFCIGVGPNLAHCTACHAGYGWVDQTFDFEKQENVDCLVCHDTTGAYRKDNEHGGVVAPGVDLVTVAQGVGLPTRRNCGSCHFAGGGGDAVKHGDLDGTMFLPGERIDVHMGLHQFDCQECHRTEHHRIPGRSMSVSVDNTQRVACTDCHAERPHRNERLDAHTRAVACQTCHIPRMAVEAPTKMSWDWSTAGRDPGPSDDPNLYSKKRGTFVLAKDVIPEYGWYNGHAERYLLGDTIDTSTVSPINRPLGDARDPRARIWPFKVHRAKQPYDLEHRTLLVPRTSGHGGYWTTFDWPSALRLGSADTGVPFSGNFGFAETEMYWPLSHMVATKDKALQCTDCHGDRGRLNWSALGYPGDPAILGGRTPMLSTGDGRGARP
ncbi:MAG: tetrathionate reductase family octaheme c-type cytochrome [Isosphaeraceae bacterium]